MRILSKEELTNRQLLQTLKSRLKKGEIKFDYDMWDREIGLMCKDYEFGFVELGLLWPNAIKELKRLKNEIKNRKI